MMRVVLDTNVVLSALLFGTERLAWIRRGWQRGQWTPLMCRETAGELLRVLAYPKFRLSAAERETLLADFLPYTESVALPEKRPALPQCQDAKDQTFLALACIGRADALISGDDDLLSMRTNFPDCPILSASEWARTMDN
ncbi:MAG: putative toxin-antitoxin system toxin component, PIN family [Azoarcus sp.]|jgi:putative PIN family toxin of toxin-antitoxin system|nr:putative toxin-antitoxin system toxin component, PIN family [Azoarcus sp.]